MRFMRMLFGVILCGGVAVAPAMGGQRGQHAPATGAAVHPATPAVPASAAVHPAPVSVPARITTNPALITRLQPLLPPGVTLATAATGFRNQGQFIAALHVSRNLNIPFAQLKTEMTAPNHDSLGQAIHALQPTANTKVAVKTAEQEAAADLKATKAPKTKTDTDADRADR